jgi:hypothetical protein
VKEDESCSAKKEENITYKMSHEAKQIKNFLNAELIMQWRCSYEREVEEQNLQLFIIEIALTKIDKV